MKGRGTVQGRDMEQGVGPTSLLSLLLWPHSSGFCCYGPAYSSSTFIWPCLSPGPGPQALLLS